ncbi:MAG: zinc ribbon domain-containing protein [Thermoplasmata archaeon]|nr:MAG: zinc ribbon domain-containing protein [Thermoplasmata archaeon]
MAFCQNCGSVVMGESCPNCGQAVAQTPNQPPAQPAQPQKQNSKKIGVIIAIIIVIVVILAAMIFVFSDSKDSDNGVFTESLTIEMNDTEHMKLEYKIEGAGNKTKEIRDTIDDDEYGEEDGEVTSDEVEKVVEVFEDLKGVTSYGYTIDDELGEYIEFNVSLKGAEGKVDSEKPITFTLTIEIEWDLSDKDQDYYRLEILRFLPFVGDLTFTCPSGYEVYEVYGLKDDITSGQTTITGTMEEDAEYINIMIKKTGVVIGDEEAEPNDSISNANPISSGVDMSGSLEEGTDEDDWYYIYFEYDDTVEIDLSGPSGTDFDIFLYDSLSAEKSSSSESGSQENIIYVVTSSEYYYVNVKSASGSGSYTLSVDIT